MSCTGWHVPWPASPRIACPWPGAIGRLRLSISPSVFFLSLSGCFSYLHTLQILCDLFTTFHPLPNFPLSLYFACVCLSLLLFSFSLLSASTYNCKCTIGHLSFFLLFSISFHLCFNSPFPLSLSISLSLSYSFSLSVFLCVFNSVPSFYKRLLNIESDIHLIINRRKTLFIFVEHRRGSQPHSGVSIISNLCLTFLLL